VLVIVSGHGRATIVGDEAWRRGRLAYDPRVLESRVLRSADELAAIRADWDRLAVAARRPYGSPEWLLPWLANVAPDGAEIRVVVVSQDERLVGVAPLFAHRGFAGVTEYRLFGAKSGHRIDPVSEPEMAVAVAEVVGAALRRVEPAVAVLRLEAIEGGSPWPAALARGWALPRAPRPTPAVLAITAPVATLDAPTFSDWLAARPTRSRKQFERLRRHHHEAGSEIRMAATPGQAAEALEAFAVLYARRWCDRGAEPFPRALLAMVREAADRMLATGRLRIWTLRLRGDIVSVQIFVAAGGQVAAWRGAFEPSLTGLAPGLVTILAAVEDAFERGDSEIDFGGGDQAYKWRFADRDRPVVWVDVLPAGHGALWTRLLRAPVTLADSEVARGIARRLPSRVRRTLRRVYR
jgi:CelD/BcsL family acetyltransferase involved in cellulose biosynthesis